MLEQCHMAKTSSCFVYTEIIIIKNALKFFVLYNFLGCMVVLETNFQLFAFLNKKRIKLKIQMKVFFETVKASNCCLIVAKNSRSKIEKMLNIRLISSSMFKK